MKVKRILAGLALIFATISSLAGATAVSAAKVECGADTKHAGEKVSDAALCDSFCPEGATNLSALTLADCYVVIDKDIEDDALGTTNKVISMIIGLIGFVAVVMIVVGGVMLATAQGDPGKATKGKNTILYSLIGLIVAILAYAIVNFVLSGIN